MASRRAYTAGSVVVLTGEGTRRRIPAGVCWIDGQPSTRGICTIHWSELGIDYSGRLSSEALQAYVLGCIVQYA